MDASRLQAILEEARTVAVVGASARPARPSHGVTRYLVERTRYEVFPVNPNYEEVAGRPCVPALADLGEPPDIVDVFRRSEAVPEVVEAAIEVGASVVWLQLGIHHPEAVERARRAGLEVVENRCLRVEHGRLFGEG